MVISCNVRECKHNDGNGFCALEKSVLIINYSGECDVSPICVDFEEENPEQQ